MPYVPHGSRTLQEAEATKIRLRAASSAMDDALSALNSKEQMMRWLDIGTTHLGLLVSIGSSAAEVRSANVDNHLH